MRRKIGPIEAGVAAAAAAVGLAWAWAALSPAPAPRVTQVTVPLACGPEGDPACRALAAADYAGAGLGLLPFAAPSAEQAAEMACLHPQPGPQVWLALGQLDAVSEAAREPPCRGRLGVVGAPAYPVYAYLVVRADNPASSLQGLVDRAEAAGRPLVVSDGGWQDGGKVTFESIQASDAQYYSVVREASLAGPASLEALRGGSGAIDAYFTMGGPGAGRDLLAAAGPGLKLVAVDPPAALLGAVSWAGAPLYRREVGPGGIPTVETDAAFVAYGLWYYWYESVGRGPALAGALSLAAAAARSGTATPASWRGGPAAPE